MTRSGNNFTAKWIGQIFTEEKRFKLFRLTGDEKTSDLSVNGEYTHRGGKAVIVIKHKVHFTAVVGLAGLLVCIYVMWFLLQKKGVLDGIIWLLLPLLMAGIIYSGFTIRDLNKNIAEIERLMQKQITVPVWNDDEEEMDGTMRKMMICKTMSVHDSANTGTAEALRHGVPLSLGRWPK